MKLPQFDMTFNQVLAVLSLVMGAIFGFWALRGREDSSKKFSATFIVISLAFAANTNAVYALSIFIAATLITELSFLENLAALLWNRQWWIRSATAQEVNEKAAAEVKEETKALSRSSNIPNEDGIQANYVEQFKEFEQQSIKALMASGIFPDGSISSGVVIGRANDRRVVLDGLIVVGMKHYIIEVKASSRSWSWTQGIGQLTMAIDVYGKALGASGQGAQIMGVFILPFVRSNLPSPLPNIGILHFDLASKHFTNLEEFRHWLASA